MVNYLLVVIHYVRELGTTCYKIEDNVLVLRKRLLKYLGMKSYDVGNELSNGSGQKYVSKDIKASAPNVHNW